MAPSPSIEEIHAKQFEIQANQVYNYSEEVILIEERKWNDILAKKQTFRGHTIEAGVSELVMRLVRRYDQDERETDGHRTHSFVITSFVIPKLVFFQLLPTVGRVTQRCKSRLFLLCWFARLLSVQFVVPSVATAVVSLYLQVRMAATVPNSCLLASKTCFFHLSTSSSLHLLSGQPSSYFLSALSHFAF